MSDETPQDETADVTPEEVVETTPEAVAAEEPAAIEESAPEDAPAEEPVAEAADEPSVAEEPAAEVADEEPADDEPAEEAAPREKPAIPGMDLDVDLVLEDEGKGDRWSEDEDPHADGEAAAEDEDAAPEPIVAEIQLSADARYSATGKRKTAIARVILKPGTGVYTINGRTMDEFFPRDTLRRNIRQPLETVGYEEKMDVVARLHGGGVSAQAGALRHGISRALLEADPNLRTELKKRGFLTRDARAKERKKAGLKKARKRPQFSKR